MTDDQPRFEDEQDSERHEAAQEAPASVVFMEMMRRAAARSQAANPPAVKPNPLSPAAPPPRTAQINRITAPQPPPAAAAAAEAVPVKPAAPARPAMTEEERQQAAQLQAEKLRRVQRRREKRRRRTVGVMGGLFRSFLVVFVSAILMATILSFRTDSDFLRPEIRRDLQAALVAELQTPVPTIVPTPNWARKIGIVSGHRGPGVFRGEVYTFDPGATCPDGLQEVDINFNVASLIVQNLRARGYRAELLDEFDPRLEDYQAAALVSIHANDCRDYGEFVSGFLISKAASRPEGGEDTLLAECIAQQYGAITGLERRPGVTVDMTDYHSFREINIVTPAAIIELGFMLGDRELLTDRPDLLAQGVTEGIICYLEPGADLVQPTAAPPDA